MGISSQLRPTTLALRPDLTMVTTGRLPILMLMVPSLVLVEMVRGTECLLAMPDLSAAAASFLTGRLLGYELAQDLLVSIGCSDEARATTVSTEDHAGGSRSNLLEERIQLRKVPRDLGAWFVDQRFEFVQDLLAVIRSGHEF